MAMLIRREVIEALHEAGAEASMMRSGIAIPGDAATFIVMLSLASKYEEPYEDEIDPRLR
jgi:hypothetical protein